MCPNPQLSLTLRSVSDWEVRAFHLLLLCSGSFAVALGICCQFTSTFMQSVIIHICWALMNVCSLEHLPGSVQSQPTSQQPPTRAEVRNQAEEQIRNVFCDTHTACSMRWRGLYEWESCKRVPAATGMEHFSAKAMENPRDNQGSC